MDNSKRNNLQIMGIPEEKEKGKEQFVKAIIVPKKYISHWRDAFAQIQKTKRAPNETNSHDGIKTNSNQNSNKTKDRGKLFND